ncbi:MAG: alkaline phosphatase family protein [Myxococcota bacterium]
MSGTHGVALAMGWPQGQTQDLLGFAISRRDGGGEPTWLPVVVQFEGRPIETGKLYPSNESPIQSMVWNDFGVSDDKTSHGLPPDTEFTYSVAPVRGTPDQFQVCEDQAVAVTVRTEPEYAEKGASVFFNRGLSDSQEYERLFGEGHVPDPNKPEDAEAMAWLARGLDVAIIKFIEEAIDDESLTLDAAVYHLDHQGVIDALAKLGKRCRVSMDWGSEEEHADPPNTGPNQPAYDRLTKAGVTVHQRRHVAISHNKYMLLKGADGKGKAILTGSTNFTNGGISTQSNQSVIVRDPEVAAVYLEDFERVLQDDNKGLREFNAQGEVISDSLEVYFSPHSASDTPDLDRFKALARDAESSMLFLTFRMTSHEVLSEIFSRGDSQDDDLLVFGVADRVYKGNDGSGDRLIYDESLAGDPRVVSAADPLDDLSEEPGEDVLYDELKREGYDPLVHHKILLADWDSPECTVVTGSANYSNNSSKNNDENSLVIRGDQRLAQQYFVEFARLYTHWRGRWLEERNYKHEHQALTLAADSSWTKTWYSGSRNTELLKLALGAEAFARTMEPTPAEKVAREAARKAAAPRMEHVIVLMLENRSFDHMMGFLPGVEGVLGDDGKVDPARYNYADPLDSTSAKYTVGQAEYFAIPADDHKDEYGGPSHSYPAATEQIFGQKYQQSSPPGSEPAVNNGFIKSYIKELKFSQKVDDPKAKHVRVAIDAFSPTQMPSISTLAEEFCVCDHWYSEVPGPTEPNRLFTHAATSEGLTHNVWDHAIQSRTIQENLAAKGHSWRFYYQDLSDSNQFPALKREVDQVRPFEKLYEDLRSGDLPAYSFLCPRYSDTDTEFANSQHAPYDVRYGEHLIADVYEAVRRSPKWKNILLIVTYDEHGGFYDHVYPPRDGVHNPDGLTSPTAYDAELNKSNPDKYGYLMGDDYKFTFQRLGCRVPAVLISPWIAKGTVDSTRYQHTSIAATLKEVYELPEFLTRRDAQANTFTSVLARATEARDDAPLTVPRPPLPGQGSNEAAPAPGTKPLGVLQRGVYATLTHLDGHPDSGKPPRVPKTQAEASAYIKERYDAHNAFHHALAKNGRFEVYQDKAGEHRWRLRDGAGQIIASSGEGMKTKAEVDAEIETIRNLAPSADRADV